MQVVLTVSHMLVRICGVILLILGLLIWVEGMRNLIGLHTTLGLIMVLAMWVMAAVASRLGAPMGLVIGVAVLGLLVVVVGMGQNSMLPGDGHWIIQIVHLLLGMAAVGIAESLGGRLRRIRLANA